MQKKILRRTVLSSAIFLSLGSAHGATILVGNGVSGCSLQDAIVAANTDSAVNDCSAGSGNDTLELISPNTQFLISDIYENSNVSGGVGLPIINTTITIEGNGLTVEADHEAENFRLFELSIGGDLTLRDTTVTGADSGFGFERGYGSGLLSNGGRVTLERTEFKNNNAAIVLMNSQGNVINASVISNNTVDSYYNASAILTVQAGLTLSHSAVTNNNWVRSDSAFLRTKSRGTYIGGSALIFNQSQVVVTNSTISGNLGYTYGGAIGINGTTAAPAMNISFINNTIINNSASRVGGIFDIADGGTITMQGNILSGNTSRYSTLNTSVDNLISYGNTTFNLDGNNIIGDRGKPQVRGVSLGASDLTFSDATSDNLYPLIASNGQLVHPLKLNSIAIDAMPLSCFGLTVDQEGKGRGKDGNNDGSFLCDIGALENAKPIVVNDEPCDLVNAINSANNDASFGGCQPGNGHDIIVLEENSLHSLDSVEFDDDCYGFFAGLPGVTTGITVAGQGSTIEKSDAFVGDLGVAIIERGGDLTFSDVTITQATGLATVFAQGGDVTLINAHVVNNQAIGILASSGDKSAVYNSTIRNNNNLGSNFDSLGAGVSVINGDNFKMKNTTISGNTSGLGAGLSLINDTNANILHSTISGNTASSIGASEGDGRAGGVHIFSSNATLTGLTITGNTSDSMTAGLLAVSTELGNKVQVQRSIISGNEVTVAPPIPLKAIYNDVNRSSARCRSNEWLFTFENFNYQKQDTVNKGLKFDEVVSDGIAVIEADSYNIFGKSGDSGTAGFSVGMTDIVPSGATNSIIETTLADNGGNTLTHKPVAGGLAVDRAVVVCQRKGDGSDQLGNIRKWNNKTNNEEIFGCDIGAVELNSIPIGDIIFKNGFD